VGSFLRLIALCFTTGARAASTTAIDYRIRPP
jgi:hypothetical protein